MAQQSNDRQTHWQNIYRTKRADSVSWYRRHLDVSLELLTEAGISAASRVIDVGGGASTLIDDLLDRGLCDVSVLDVSEQALAVAQRRLGERAKLVKWYAGDVLEIALPSGAFDFWHDRAVLHFLTDASDARRYAQSAANAVVIGGHAVIAGFAPDGPERCSGLSVSASRRRTSLRYLHPRSHSWASAPSGTAPQPDSSSRLPTPFCSVASDAQGAC